MASVGCRCECGADHMFPSYVFAHWEVELIHKCECGRSNVICRGKVKIEKKGEGISRADDARLEHRSKVEEVIRDYIEKCNAADGYNAEKDLKDIIYDASDGEILI